MGSRASKPAPNMLGTPSSGVSKPIPKNPHNFPPPPVSKKNIRRRTNSIPSVPSSRRTVKNPPVFVSSNTRAALLTRPRRDKYTPEEFITVPQPIPDTNEEENESPSSQTAPPPLQVAPQVASPQVAPPSPQVAPRFPSPPLEFDLILVRHGISCGNLAKKKGQRLLQHSYTDPELTTWGRAKAKALGPYLKAALEWPVVVGSSNLLRAQQTAFLMLEPEEVLIVPYISEKGTGEDNRAFSKQGQKTILEQYTCGDMARTNPNTSYLKNASIDTGAKINWTYFEEASKASTPSTENFLAWLRSKYLMLVANYQDDTMLVFFSHGRFIRDFILEQVANNPRFKDTLFPSVPFHLLRGKAFDKMLHDAMKNYTATRFRVKIDNRKGIRITDIQFLKYEKGVPENIRQTYAYSKDLDAAKECEIDGCRKRICEGLFQTRRSQKNVCNAAKTLKVPSHRGAYLKVMTDRARLVEQEEEELVEAIQTASAASATTLQRHVLPFRNNAAADLASSRLRPGNAPPPPTTPVVANNGSNNNNTEFEVEEEEQYNS